MHSGRSQSLRSERILGLDRPPIGIGGRRNRSRRSLLIKEGNLHPVVQREDFLSGVQ